LSTVILFISGCVGVRREPKRAFVNENVRKRDRQRARQMQAEIDGRSLVETPRSVRPPFIEPASLRAGFNMDDGDLVWIAVWNPNRNLAVAVDITSDEIEPCEHSLRSGRRVWGDNYAGPFPSKQQARAFAVEKLTAARKGSARGLQAGSE
jgi:hypothetical protein